MKQPFLRNRDKTELFIELLAVSGIVGSAFLYLFSISSLPEMIPTHFDFSGKPDDWGSKYNIIIPFIVALFLYILLTGTWLFIANYKYPAKINPALREIQAVFAKKLILILKAELSWVFFYILYKTIQVTNGNAEGLGQGFIFVFLTIIFGTTGEIGRAHV